MDAKKPTAADLSLLLAARHSEDVWVPECKDGPTQMGPGMLQLDGWAMKRSWSKPCMYGYEIKVSRSDFARDEKWHGYLPLCNRFSFVCPRGLIEPMELPPEVGLLWATKAGTKLIQKKPAAYREIKFPEMLFTYILMCRTTVGTERNPDGNAQYWRKWLETRDERRGLGQRVSAETAKRYRSMEDRLQQAERAAETFGPVREWLERHGLGVNEYSRPIHQLNRIDALTQYGGAVNTDLIRRTAEQARTYLAAAESFLSTADTEEG